MIDRDYGHLAHDSREPAVSLLEQLALDPITQPEEHELNPHPKR